MGVVDLMKIGFTGSSTVITSKQLLALYRELANYALDVSEYHHGDCIKGDAEFHNAVVGLVKTVIHPPINPSKRAFCTGPNVEVREPKDYLVRNDDIAREVDVLYACPDTFKEVRRSGTWTTVRYARKYNKRIVVIYPDGTVV